MADTGFLATQSFADKASSAQAHRDIQFGKVSVSKGMVAENAVAQQLLVGGHALYYHARAESGLAVGAKRRPREVDLLLARSFKDVAGKLRVSPVAVKSSKSCSTVFLNDFKARYGKRVGEKIVLHPKQLRVEGSRSYFPLCMAHLVWGHDEQMPKPVILGASEHAWRRRPPEASKPYLAGCCAG